MITRDYNFGFNDLTLDLNGLHAALGYPESALPEPFDSFLLSALKDASELKEFRATSLIAESIRIDTSKGSLQAEGRTFRVGKTICNELRGAEKLLFFVCTAGKSISEKSAELLKGEDPAKGYIYDQVGTFLAEAIGDKMQQLLLDQLATTGERITNRYSPGYCNWDVADQHQLFAMFPFPPSGVTLTPSALMSPVKSISGVIGLGKEVNFRDYPCVLCNSLSCIYRKIHSGTPGRH
jgi:hypothetical protein